MACRFVWSCRALAASLALAVGVGAFAPRTVQAQEFRHAYQTWTALTFQANVNRDVVFFADLHGRFYDDFHPYFVLVRPAIGVRLIDGMFAWVGYGWTPSWNDQRTFVDEHRVWEQWSFDPGDLGGGARTFFRVRFEQRMRPGIGSDVALRLRLMARVLIPFAAGSPVHLSVWDELFIAFTDSGDSMRRLWQRAGYDQNRAFIGVGWNIDPAVRLESGYMNHWIRSPGGDAMHHVALAQAFFTWR